MAVADAFEHRGCAAALVAFEPEKGRAQEGVNESGRREEV